MGRVGPVSVLAPIRRAEEEWLEHAPCAEHQSLYYDAWFDVTAAGLGPLGREAFAVCQTRCPVNRECFDRMAPVRPRETIAGGGWWDTRGRFHTSIFTETMDTKAVSAFLGLSPSVVLRMVQDDILVPVGRSPGARAHVFAAKDVLSVLKARKETMRHGTSLQYEAHLIRGEKPCEKCVAGKERKVKDRSRS